MTPAMQKISRRKRAVAYTVIVAALPFVCLWRAWVALKWRVWSGRIYLKHHHGRR